jgi:hypothetical protein
MYKIPSSSHQVTLWYCLGRRIEGFLVKVGMSRARFEESSVANVVFKCWGTGKSSAKAAGVDVPIPTGKTELGFAGIDASSLGLQSLALGIKDTANILKPIYQDVCFVAHGVSEYFLLDSLYLVPTDQDVSTMGGFRLQTFPRLKKRASHLLNRGFCENSRGLSGRYYHKLRKQAQKLE